MTDKTDKPAREGWFTLDRRQPALLGRRCESCGTVYFPPSVSFCRNPDCSGEQFTEVPLSRFGRIWSCTDACYAPPPPYQAVDPYEPFTLAAVELEAERMIVLGQLVAGVGPQDVHIGDRVELVLDTLFEDDAHRYLVWKWRPLSAEASA